jgi:hypothetical protein
MLPDFRYFSDILPGNPGQIRFVSLLDCVVFSSSSPLA